MSAAKGGFGYDFIDITTIHDEHPVALRVERFTRRVTTVRDARSREDIERDRGDNSAVMLACATVSCAAAVLSSIG